MRLHEYCRGGNKRLWLHVLVAVVNNDMFGRLFEEVEERGANSRKRGGGGEECRFRRSFLCEGQPSLVVDLENLLDGVDVGGRPQVQTKIVLARCAHDLPGRPLHGVGQTRVNNVFF